MAERRMFAKTIIDSDAFLDMPMTAQLLYFHLSMRADDEGFLNNPKKIQRMIGASDDDLKLLKLKKFILTFDTGVIVIKHWKINNYLQKDRCKPTIYQKEKSMLGIKTNKAYTLNFDDPNTKLIQDISSMDTKCIQDVSKMDTECIQNGYTLDTDCIHENSSKNENELPVANMENDENRINTNVDTLDTECIQNGYTLDTQVRLGKVRKEEINNINLVRLGIEVAETNTNDQTEPNESEILLNAQIKWNKLQDIGIEPIRPLKAKSQRANKLMAIINEYGLGSFDEAIQKIRESDWLNGSKDGTTWKVDFDWITDPKHYSLILDGYYRDYNPFPDVKSKRKGNTFNQMQSYSGENITELEEKLIDN